MRLVAQSTLLLRVRRRLDAVNDTSIEDAEISELLDDAAAALHLKLLSARGQEYYRTSVTSTAVASGQWTITLPADCLDLVAVFGKVGSEWVRLTPHDQRELDAALNFAGVASHASQLSYRRGGTQADGINSFTDLLELWPAVPAGAQVRVDYVPTVRNYSGGNDVVYNGVAGFEELLVNFAVSRLRRKEDRDVGVELAWMREVDALIADLPRDASAPEHIVDERRDLGADPLWPLPRPRLWWP